MGTLFAKNTVKSITTKTEMRIEEQNDEETKIRRVESDKEKVEMDWDAYSELDIVFRNSRNGIHRKSVVHNTTTYLNSWIILWKWEFVEKCL